MGCASLPLDHLALAERHRREVAQRIVDLGDRVGVAHQVQDRLLRGLRFDPSAVADVAGWAAFTLEIAADLHLYLLNHNAALGRFAVDVVAIAGG